ncbi:MAG: hypothetical protein JNL70_02430 [Saprospiraceae bacterium]|nr:hypothetical protein [Saprospiraceae bacterium]
MKRAFIFCILFFIVKPVIACDVCGCVLSHNILPSDTRTFIGVNYRISRFSGSHSEAANLPAEFFKESYQFMDFTVKYSLKNRWEFIAVLPMGQFTQNTEGVLSDKIKGLGDMNLTTRYALINRTGLDNHRLSVGATIEFPTGKYNQISEDKTLYHSRQTGSGATNFVFSLSYGFKRQTWGFQTVGSYKINNENPLGYRRGNSLNGALDVFYKKKVFKNIDVIPRLGIAGETANRNQLNGINYDLNTSRSFLLGNVAFDVYFSKTFISLSYQKPLSQTLETEQLANKGRMMISVNYLF